MQNKLLFPVVAGIVALVFVAAATTSHQQNNVPQQDAEYSAQTQSAENVSPESSGDFNQSDAYWYGPNGGKCAEAGMARYMYEQQGQPLPQRFVNAITKCENYARLAAEESRKNPPKHGALYSSSD